MVGGINRDESAATANAAENQTLTFIKGISKRNTFRQYCPAAYKNVGISRETISLFSLLSASFVWHADCLSIFAPWPGGLDENEICPESDLEGFDFDKCSPTEGFGGDSK